MGSRWGREGVCVSVGACVCVWVGGTFGRQLRGDLQARAVHTLAEMYAQTT